MTNMMTMSMEMSATTWITLLIAAAIAFGLGGIWYGPLFGKAWCAEQPHRKSKDFKNSTAGMIVQALHLIAMGFVFFALAQQLTAWCAFIMLALMTGLGMLSGGIFLGHSRKLLLINIGCQFLALAVFTIAALL